MRPAPGRSNFRGAGASEHGRSQERVKPTRMRFDKDGAELVIRAEHFSRPSRASCASVVRIGATNVMFNSLARLSLEPEGRSRREPVISSRARSGVGTCARGGSGRCFQSTRRAGAVFFLLEVARPGADHYSWCILRAVRAVHARAVTGVSCVVASAVVLGLLILGHTSAYLLPSRFCCFSIQAQSGG